MPYRNDALKALRARMKAKHLAAYYIGTADPHQSEYISPAFRSREWLTGFTGSAGTALVTATDALLWVDGRYFIQAAKELEGSEFKMMKLDTKGYPSLTDWLKAHVKPGSQLGMAAELISEAAFKRLQKSLCDAQIKLTADHALIAELWEDRPALPSAPIYLHPLQFTGMTALQKLERMRGKMASERIDMTIIAGLDDVAWLMNFRGRDVAHTPVSLAYALVDQDKATLFIDAKKLDEDSRAHMAENKIKLAPYAEIGQAISQLPKGRMAVNKKRLNRALFRAIPEQVTVIERIDYPTEMKAKLNDVELACQRQSYLRDSAAFTRLIYHVKKDVKSGQLTELGLAETLHQYRSEDPLFIEESFETISAYGPHAAMMHYSAKPEQNPSLQPKSFYLIDSGGQYYDGTTDITRTVACGPLTEEEKTDYTLCLKGHINLADSIFLEGSTGQQLDALARQPLWRAFLDYKSGTGHAVGYLLGVHEGPHRIAKKASDTVLEPRMVITIEPGVYKEGKHGIRLENDYLISFAGEAHGDRFLQFEALSFVPLEREAILVDLLSPEERAWVNSYHAAVQDACLDALPSEAEKTWLKAACAPI